MTSASPIDWIGNRTIRDLIDERASHHPERSCMVVEKADGTVAEYTYGQFRTELRRVAAGLQRIGVGRGDTVVLMLPNSAEFVFTWLGASLIGAIAVPANVSNTSAEMAHVINHCGARVVITSQRLQATIDAIDDIPTVRERFLVDAEEPCGSWAPFAELRGDADALAAVDIATGDIAQLVFTSGSTSLPKAVMLTHANFLHSGVRGAASSGAHAQDRLLTALPAFHVNAQSFTILAALTVGATFILLEQYSASRFTEQLRRHGATLTSLVAMQVRTLLAQPPSEDDSRHSVRRSIYAMTVSQTERDEFERRFGIELLNGYGLSEAMTGVSVVPLGGEHRWPSIGLPAFGLRVRLIDENGRDVPPGTPGEIVVGGERGRTVMLGYYRDADATARAFQDGWLRTGDVAYADDRGYLYFVDRLKDVIKRAGENVSASEVESVLASLPMVAEVAVIGVPDPIRDEAVKAFVVLRDGWQTTADELIELCRSRLSAFKVPSIVEFRTTLPKTSIGKVEKRRLRAEEATPLDPSSTEQPK